MKFPSSQHLPVPGKFFKKFEEVLVSNDGMSVESFRFEDENKYEI